MTQLSEADWANELRSSEREAFRLELQPAYTEADESDTVARFLAGDPQPPSEVPSLAAWFGRVAWLTKQGKRIERVRVHECPPTPFQRWERWAGAWNTRAGERIRYLTWARAHDIGLLPAAGTKGWWLIDGHRLIVMRFDPEGRRITNELITAPAAIEQAVTWRDLALRHSVDDVGR